MPRHSKGPYLYFRKKTKSYVIRDGQKEVATGCSIEEIEQAQLQLKDYIADKFEPERRRDSGVDCGTVIISYLEAKLPEKKTVHRFNELKSQGNRLIDFWGNKRLRDVIGATCREYTEKATTVSMARHDLEIFRAAANHYKREYGLESVPTFTLPPKGKPRPDYLTRNMAAKLLWSAHRRRAKHLVRFLLISYYTGTRSGAVFGLQWFPNTVGGYVDFENNLIYRAPAGEGNSGNKRKAPATIPNKLLPWLKRWHKEDSHEGATIRNIVHFEGRSIKTVKGAFKKARTGAKLPDWVIPHLLRHSSITWAMQQGKNINDVAKFFSITVKELERTYWHHSPDYQKEMRG